MSHRALGVTSWRTLGVSLLVMATSACGFRLQGDIALPETVQAIELGVQDRQSDFAHALAARLRSAGIEVSWAGVGSALAGSTSQGSTSQGSTAATTVTRARLQIEVDEFIERVASVSARNVPREYELTYRVRYSFEAVDDPQVGAIKKIDSEELTLAREFSFDERVALAKQREREQLRSTLANELAGMVLQRIASLK